MKLFIQIEIGDWKQTAYNKPWTHFASSLSSDLIGTDLDSQSDPVVADLVLKLIDEAEKVFVLTISHDARVPLGAAEKVFRHLSQFPDKVSKVITTGAHDGFSGLMNKLADKVDTSSDDAHLRIEIQKFAK